MQVLIVITPAYFRGKLLVKKEKLKEYQNQKVEVFHDFMMIGTKVHIPRKSNLEIAEPLGI